VNLSARVFCGLLTVFSLALIKNAWGDTTASRPNIILITIDTFRADRVGYDGYHRDTSPALDAFSREGVFFKKAFTTSGWTSPGLISLLTSLYAPTHGVDVRGKSINPQIETLPDVLKRAGYRVPDIFFLTDIPNFTHLGFESYAKRLAYIDQGDEILFKWLDEETADKSPFFLYYHYRELHLPYNPEAPYDTMFMPKDYLPGSGLVGGFKRFLAHEKMDAVRKNVMLVRGVADFSKRDTAWVDGLYDGQVRRLDDRLFAPLRVKLKERGLWDNTLVIISADHGEELLDHELIGHVSTYKEGRLYDPVIRIPLVLWGPGFFPSGRVVETPVQCIDLMPTLLAGLGLEGPNSVQGQSLWPLIEGRPGWKDRPMFCETSGGGYTADAEAYAKRYRAVRTKRWKLTYASPEDHYALYDLSQDPGEDQDVAASHAGVVDSLRTLLNEWVLYSQPRVYQATAPADTTAAPQVVTHAPEILFPADGDTLFYQGGEHAIHPQWTGAAAGAYVMEYEVGQGAYHLSGELDQYGTSPTYGPFQDSFWNSLVLYNPWRFRVYPKHQPNLKSGWVTFYLASSDGVEGGFSWSGLLLGAGLSLRHSGEITAQLLWGLGRGLADLYGWVGLLPPADLSAYGLILAIVGVALRPWYQRIGIRRVRAWSLAAFYIGFVYSTIPVMPQVWGTLREYTQGTVRYLGIVLIAAFCLGVVYWVVRRFGARHWGPYLALGLIGVAYAYMLAAYARFPAERLHLVEYGLVAYLLYRALKLDTERAYALSFILTVLVGAGDECIQWFLPQRVFELKDIQLNAVSGALGLLMTRFVLESKQPATTTD